MADKDKQLVKRTNLQEIKELREKLKELEQETDEAVSPSKTVQKKRVIPDPNRKKQDPYAKRKPLTKEESKFLSDLWYTGEAGYAGRENRCH